MTRDVLDEEVLKLSDEHPAPDLESGCLSAEGLEVDPGDFGSAVEAHRALAHELAAALRAVGFHLGHLAVELAVPQIDLLDSADEFRVGAAVLLLQDRPERW